jgi:hypothetical protein
MTLLDFLLHLDAWSRFQPYARQVLLVADEERQ